MAAFLGFKPFGVKFTESIMLPSSIWARISSGAFKDLNIACGKNIYVMFKSAAVTDSLRIVH